MPTAVVDPIEATPGLPEDDVTDPAVPEDDVTDPAVPAGATAPLPAVTLQQVRDDLHGMARVLDAGLASVPPMLDRYHTTILELLMRYREALAPADAGALQHLCEALHAVQTQGVQVSGAPYAAQVIAKTPAGFMVTIAIQRGDGAAFFEDLGKMQSWLAANAYTPAQ